jgi:hypothetical protein
MAASREMLSTSWAGLKARGAGAQVDDPELRRWLFETQAAFDQWIAQAPEPIRVEFQKRTRQLLSELGH